jgi:hypothetical protein
MLAAYTGTLKTSRRVTLLQLVLSGLGHDAAVNGTNQDHSVASVTAEAGRRSGA